MKRIFMAHEIMAIDYLGWFMQINNLKLRTCRIIYGIISNLDFGLLNDAVASRDFNIA